MDIKRENTVFFNFRECPFVPNDFEIQQWFASNNIFDGELKVIDFHYHTKHALIKFTQKERFEKFLQDFGNSIDYKRNDEVFQIPIIVAGSRRKTIKIRYVPFELEIKNIYTALEQYGKIEKISRDETDIKKPEHLFQVKREKLTIEMTLSKNIPSYITVLGLKLNVSYIGQPKTCAKCDSTNHEAKDCNAPKSYSQITKSFQQRPMNLNEPLPTSNLEKAVLILQDVVKEGEMFKKTSENKRRTPSHNSDSDKNSDPEKWTKVTKKGRTGSMNNMETEIDEDTPSPLTQQTISLSTQYTLLSQEDSDLCSTDEDEPETNPKSSPKKKPTKKITKPKTKKNSKKLQKMLKETGEKEDTEPNRKNGTSGFPWNDTQTENSDEDPLNTVKEINPPGDKYPTHPANETDFCPPMSPPLNSKQLDRQNHALRHLIDDDPVVPEFLLYNTTNHSNTSRNIQPQNENNIPEVP